MESFLVILGFVIYSVIGLTLLFLTDKYILINKQKDVVIDRRQNIKIGDTWVTLTNKEPESIEPKYTDYELELINEIDNAFKSYIENKGILNDNDVEMLNQFVKLNPKTKMKFSYENEKMYNVKFLL